MHPSNRLSTFDSPLEDLEVMDEAVELAGQDEDRTMFDPDSHPKKPHKREEAVTDMEGSRTVDVMVDTPKLEDEFEFDLTEDEIRDADLF